MNKDKEWIDITDKLPREERSQDFQSKLLDILSTHGGLTRGDICEVLGYERYEYKNKYPAHNQRTTVFDNLEKLRKKGKVEKVKEYNGKRGRPKEVWRIIL